MANQRVRDMTTGTPWKLLLSFMLPLVGGNLFQQVYSMVDTIVVGRTLGVDALAGVGSTGSVSFLVMGFCMGITSGCAIPVAQKFGEKDYEGLRKYVGNMIWLCAGVALVFMVTTTVLCKQILTWMNNPADTFHYAYNYIFWTFMGIPFTMTYNLLAGVIRSLGDSKTPLYFLIFSSCLNVVLDLVFILVFHMGVMGASLATVISQAVSGMLCLSLIVKNYPILKLNKDDLKPRKFYLGRLASMGVPMGLQFSITALGGTVLQTTVNGLGTASMAAMTAGNKVSLFLDCPLSAFGTAMATFAGQNLGAGRLDRVRKGFQSSVIIGVAYCAVLAVVAYFWGKPIALLFLDGASQEVIDLCWKFLMCNAALFVLLLYVFLLRMTLQGLGYSPIVVIAGVLEMFARAGVAVGLVPFFGFTAVCIANPAAWIAADIFLAPTYIICMRRLEKKQAEKELNKV